MIADLDTNTAPAAGNQIQRLNLGELHASPTNPRKHFDVKGIEELANSIEEHGVKMPLLCRPSKTEPGKKEIVAGERRYRSSAWLVEQLALRQVEAQGDEAERLSALCQARMDVPVIVEDLDDATVLELQLIENLQRRDLTALEEARGYQNLLDLKEKSYTPKMIAQKISKSIDTVLNKLKMLKAPKIMLDALEAGKLTERHLVLVAGVIGEKQREKCAKEVLEGEYDWQIQARSPFSIRHTILHINQNYRQTLKGAPWSLDDATLLADAGPCATCPHFARHAATQDAELAAELGNERGQTDPLTCMNPACFKQKQAAVWKQKEELNKKGEVVVIKPKEAEKIMNDYGTLNYGSGWVKLDDKPDSDITGHYDASKTPTWREVVEDRLPTGAVHVVNTKGAGIIELVKKTVAIEAGKAHKKHGKIFEKVKPTGKKEPTDAEKKQKAKEAFDNKVLKQSKIVQLQYLYERALERGMNAEAGLAVLDTALREAGMDGCRLMCEWLVLEPTEKKKNQATVGGENYRAALLKHLTAKDAGKPETDALIMIAQVAKWVKNYGLKFSSLEPLQKHFGFDEKTIMALATAEVQAALDAKKKPEKAAKPGKAGKNSTDPVDVSTAKEVSKTKAADKRWKAKSGRKEAPKDAKPEPDLEDDEAPLPGTEYYHCDECHGVCAVDCDLVADVESLKVGEFKCSECAEGLIFGAEFSLVANQEEYEVWPVEEKAARSKGLPSAKGKRRTAVEERENEELIQNFPAAVGAEDAADADYNDAE